MSGSIPNSKSIYHNYTVLSPDGIEMFRCDKKKFDWYLKRSLAIQIDEDVIRLLFKPKGLGWAGEHFYLQDRENKCCVCGSSNNLTKHHVVPYCYRRYMPIDIKENNYFDVLPVCVDCHANYEKIAQNKKKELAKQYEAPLEGINNIAESRYFKHARTLKKHGSKIPESRRKEMIESIAEELGITEQELEEVIKCDTEWNKEVPNFKSHGEIVISKIPSIQNFFEEWRSHFVASMKPKYLPKNWEIERDSHGRRKTTE